MRVVCLLVHMATHCRPFVGHMDVECSFHSLLPFCELKMNGNPGVSQPVLIRYQDPCRLPLITEKNCNIPVYYEVYHNVNQISSICRCFFRWLSVCRITLIMRIMRMCPSYAIMSLIMRISSDYL